MFLDPFVGMVRAGPGVRGMRVPGPEGLEPLVVVKEPDLRSRLLRVEAACQAGQRLAPGPRRDDDVPPQAAVLDVGGEFPPLDRRGGLVARRRGGGRWVGMSGRRRSVRGP